MKKLNAGFTLVELIIVIAILAILSVAALVGYGQITKNARASEINSDVATLVQQANNFNAVASTPYKADDILAIINNNGYDAGTMFTDLASNPNSDKPIDVEFTAVGEWKTLSDGSLNNLKSKITDSSGGHIIIFDGFTSKDLV